jgi:hypothetical protein
VGQLSFYSAEARPPGVADLAGLLCGPGQAVSFGRGTAARVSALLPDRWRGETLLRVCAERGVAAELAPAAEGRSLLRTPFRADLSGLVSAWTRGLTCVVPASLPLRPEPEPESEPTPEPDVDPEPDESPAATDPDPDAARGEYDDEYDDYGDFPDYLDTEPGGRPIGGAARFAEPAEPTVEAVPVVAGQPVLVKALPADFELTGAVLRVWALAAGTWADAAYLLGLDPAAPDTHEPLRAALAWLGLPTALVPDRGAGPALRVVGRRRLARLAELVGGPPPGVAERVWPAA